MGSINGIRSSEDILPVGNDADSGRFRTGSLSFFTNAFYWHPAPALPCYSIRRIVA